MASHSAQGTAAQHKDHEENIFLFVPNLIGVSCLLDALDGATARHLGQSTQFGAVLDMVTDRCTTTCLLVFLASAFPRWSIAFQSLISLDHSSHYIHMYATLAMGGNRQSHKQIDEILFMVCALNELFFIALYLLSFSSSPSLMDNASLKASQFDPSRLWSSSWSAGAMEMARANKLNETVPWCLLYVSTPFMLFKQYVNMIQLIEASKRNARLAQKRDQ
ncbi:hypothetical protein BDV30DRAFT_224125 [Aspergillus minisclerotigenes]|uniref:CDP-diacylglycerol--inositol 3-phosphatidyltransferase n=1 Tax=Aspergillus minisclerotigenes TaxID=656917 RepID=A0A5N6JET5_9EURO|nr:hypothetical protein BDV30DRAFT_224125 [Aspergillus minisclerotigenes]